MKILKVGLGNSKFAIPVKLIEEIINTVEFSVFPGQHKYTKGFFNYRGREVQIINLSGILKEEYKHAYIKQMIIVLRDKNFSFLIDEIGDILDVNNKELIEPGKGTPNYRLTTKVFIGENLPMYNIDKIIRKVKR